MLLLSDIFDVFLENYEISLSVYFICFLIVSKIFILKFQNHVAFDIIIK